MVDRQKSKTNKGLEISEGKFKNLFDSSIDGFILTDMEGNIQEVNQAYLDMLGYTKQEIIKLSYQDITPSRWHRVEESIVRNQIMVRGYSDEYEKEYIRKDATVFPISIRVWLIKDDDGNPLGMWGIVRDITARKTVEKEMKETVEIKSRFTSMISHELRAPLGPIHEGVSIILDGIAGEINKQQREMLEMVKSNTTRLNRLINDVLDFKKLESGMMRFDIEKNDMNEVVRGVHKTMEIMTKKKGLDFIMELEQDLPRIKFDRDRIEQVLINFANNAIKFTERGCIKFKTTKGDGFIKVVIQDTGPGIKEEDMPKLFQSFTQLDTTKAHKKNGTGLGLAISKQIVEEHQGKVWAESELGKGATFHFAIPEEMKERKRIGEILVEQGAITEVALMKALERQKSQD